MTLSACTSVSPAELEARLRLHRLPELGQARFKKLLEAFGSASKALSAPASAWRALGLPLACSEARRSAEIRDCLLYTSPSPRDRTRSRMPSSA